MEAMTAGWSRLAVVPSWAGELSPGSSKANSVFGGGGGIKKTVLVRAVVGPLRRISWFDPAPPQALDALVRSSFGVPASREYLLTDETCTPVALRPFGIH